MKNMNHVKIDGQRGRGRPRACHLKIMWNVQEEKALVFTLLQKKEKIGELHNAVWEVNATHVHISEAVKKKNISK